MPRILVVDDDTHRRLEVADAIRRLTDYRVEEITGEDLAGAWWREDTCDLILLDARLRGAGALAWCKQLRAHPETRGVPVLLLTPPHFCPDPQMAALDLGPVDLVAQPVGREHLIGVMRSALRMKTLSEAVRLRTAIWAERAPDPARPGEMVASDLRAECEALKEMFDVFAEAIALLSSAGQVIVANAAGDAVVTSSSKATLLSWACLATPNLGPRDCEGTEGGRTWVARVYPLRGGRRLLCVRDVTADRDDEMRRLQAEKLASIGMLAAGVAHEINNPAAFVVANLDAVSGRIRALQDGVSSIADSDSKTRMSAILFETSAILQESKEGMARIHRIVRELSAFSHVDDQEVGLIEVNAVVDWTLGILGNELRHRASIDRDLQATRVVRCASGRLGQVFLNLIMNAVQAVDETRRAENRIRIRTYDVGADVIFEVADNGSGISPEVLPRVFDSFFTTKPRGFGTGLGLSISQGIVVSLGGGITIESEVGRGTLFRVRLPSEPAVRSEAKPAPGGARSDFRRRRVLAVDDEALLLKAYRRMIGDVHEVVTALGGRDAMFILRKRQDFDVILCDLQMPEMSGMELFMTAKKEFPSLAHRFVFVTGGAFSSEARQFLEQAVTCLSKPFSVDELMALIEATGGAESAPLDDPLGLPERAERRGRSAIPPDVDPRRSDDTPPLGSRNPSRNPQQSH